jgi:hypothetical protein
MKVLLKKPFFRKHGKKALIIYLCWCVIKLILFILLGNQLFT